MRGLTLSATFAALISVLSLVAIPIPFTPVPVTLQVLAVFLSAAILGPIYGAASCVIYLVIGAVGLPVFAGATSGMAVLLGPLGGYLFSYPVAALVGGAASRVRSSGRRMDTIRVVVCCAVALLVIYAIGAVWLGLYLGLSLPRAFLLGVVPFAPFDVLKALAAVPIAARVRWARLPLPIDSA